MVDYSLDDPPYVVVPFAGVPLTTLASELDLDRTSRILEDVCAAVQVAHTAGIVHRDIKPDNVVIAESGRGVASLIDFGICQHDVGGVFLTTTNEALGNRSFAAPELGVGSREAPSERSDIYALGKLLFWMASGGCFFPRESFMDAMDLIPEPNLVERGHIQRLLEISVAASARDRHPIDPFMKRVRSARGLVRQGVNAVGVRKQVCRSGRLRREREFQPDWVESGWNSR